ncbi:hypothetical protein [Rhodococcus sp. IEGM 1341]|uniref:hypothetical protein n=1 Tax=Rhodococcus sp. IEGM 1341 TaxID=3047090 RepID=UPI0024B70887|nr:hypothetical protein [Rhodococcus sp. IEGM 1341]MDI9924979.1 hypothetical protein [Rhodococcus sp. IEGM 1341]
MTDSGDGGAGRADPDRPSWAGLAPMNHVHQQGSGLSETYWRAEQAALERRRGQRWGLPAAALVLGLNLAGFLVLGLVVTSDASAVFVVGIMIPSLLATGVAVAISKSRGNGPVVDFGLPRSIPEFLGHLRSGLAWGGVARGRRHSAGSDSVVPYRSRRPDAPRHGHGYGSRLENRSGSVDLARCTDL